MQSLVEDGIIFLPEICHICCLQLFQNCTTTLISFNAYPHRIGMTEAAQKQTIKSNYCFTAPQLIFLLLHQPSPLNGNMIKKLK